VERRLGVTLLDRTKRPLELTQAGRIYSEFCRDVLRREEEFSLSLESLKGDVEGTVRVVSIYSTGLSEMSRLGAEFAAKYPTAQLHVEYMRPDKIYDAVRDDAADLGLVSYPEPSREIAAIPWREEEMQVAVPPNHPFAMLLEVYPADLNGHAFIGFDEDLRIRRELDRFLRAQGIEVNFAMHFDNIQAEIEQGRLVAVRLNAPGLVRPVGIVHRRKKKFNRATEALLGMLMAARA
jgi:DNA-binding transcriptional LysR family regulator